LKNLHIPTILVTLGLVGLVAILSGQSTVGTPRVVVHNPLGVPGWVPSDVWMARYGHDPATGTNTFQDYTVPAGHFALVLSVSDYDSTNGKVLLDEGGGFYALAGSGYAGGDLEPGIVVDEGCTLRASGKDPATVHGYLIPK